MTAPRAGGRRARRGHGRARRHHLRAADPRRPARLAAGSSRGPTACWPAGRRARRCCGQTGVGGRWLARRRRRAWPPGTAVAEIEGPARAVLAAERTLLNLLCHLSGVATLTAAYARGRRAPAAVLDTRKTTPGMRALEKAAVRRRGRHEPPHGALRPGAGEGQPPRAGRGGAGRRRGPGPPRAAGRARGGRGGRPRRACAPPSPPAPTGSCSTT